MKGVGLFKTSTKELGIMGIKTWEYLKGYNNAVKAVQLSVSLEKDSEWKRIFCSVKAAMTSQRTLRMPSC